MPINFVTIPITSVSHTSSESYFADRFYKWIIDFLYYDENQENTVTIYNRWGDILQTIQNYDNVNNYWNGTNGNDQYLPSGTYFFTIEVPSNNIRCSNWVQIVKEN